ncbi:MAG: DNA polymerase IV [Clostridia bacterium]|nr:DNA polymerase IV [Clostridia bacterium]
MAHGIILHSDLNCFYASVEMNEHPELKGLPVAVCGSTENRHGIVLTASYPAKRMGVKTAMANWQARQICPELICVPPNYDLYIKYSRLVRRIYQRYSNDVEPFGMDESWLSLPYSSDVRTTGLQVAEEIRRAIREELGLTVSIGVSFSKIFAKLGSDLKKPDAITVIDEDNFREKIWPLPASELLYVGNATARKLMSLNILTIGDLARCEPEVLHAKLGKNGLMLWRFAAGLDTAPVMPCDFTPPVKSVGHGTTCVVDLESDYPVWLVLYELSQDVGHRLRRDELAASGVQITVKTNDLAWRQYQMPLSHPTQSPLEIARTGYLLFKRHFDWEKPVRALTIRGINLVSAQQPVQTDLFSDYARRDKRRALDDAVDEIRRRFGYRSICAASLMGDLKMAQDRCETVIMPGVMYQ